ncbi:hypothetical protein ZHAS_00020366 [Anopheles sinensis]|uniref:PHD-type domain-containing protein n=1 Tax=Anopheles sinensis TaxID=74873 RepID=A0A084WPV7_ANOSI|nr:hypothetical protein ZHAS_00020366 [Anopheles sinensis]
MSQAYSLHVLKVAVARICQTIGWHSTHTTPIDLLIDVTQHFVREMCRIMMRYCELYNRTEPNLDDLALAYRDMGINLQELMEYIQFVDPILLPFEVPRFPVPRESNLNFLKPGSREMMMRPLHIPWYMPPMFPELEEAAPVVEGGELAADEEKALALPSRAPRAILDVMGADSAEPDAAELKLLEGATLSEITIEDTGERVASEPLVEDGALLPETAVVNEEVEIPMQTVEVKEPTEAAPTTAADATLLPPPPVPRDVGKRPEAPLDKGADTSKANNAQASTGEGRPTRNISSVIMTTSGFISPAREGKLPDSRIPIIPEERPPKMLQPPPPPPPSAVSAPHPVSAQGVAASSSGPTHTHPHARDNKHASPLSGGTPALSAPSAAASLKPAGAGGGGVGGEKSGKKVKKKPIDRERKKGDKKGSSATPRVEKSSSTGSEPKASGVGGAQAAAGMDSGGGAGWGGVSGVLPTPQLEPASAVGSHPPTVATVGPVSFLQPSDGASHQFGVFPPPQSDQPSPSVVKVSSGKAGKEKALKKRKAPPAPDIALLSAPELFDKLPPPAKQPKVKSSTKRLKQTKKLQALQQAGAEGQALFAPTHGGPSVATVSPFQPVPDGAQPPPPLIGPWRPGGGSLLGDKFPLPNAPSTPLIPHPPTPELLGKAPTPFGHQTPKQKTPSTKGKGEVAASEQAAQLSLLQMMHPSLEITASPSVPNERTPPKATGKKAGSKAKEAKMQLPAPEPRDDRDVIVIDDDKSPPRTPSLLLPPPSESKKQRKQQQASIARHPPDNLFGAASQGGEYDFSMSSPGANPLSFRDFSSPEGGHHGAGGIPKTPDIKLPLSATSSPLLDVDGRKAGKSDAFSPDASLPKTPIGGVAPPAVKPKRQKQKTPKGDPAGAKQAKVDQQQQPDQPQFGAGPEQNRNMFPLFPPGPQGLGQYSNYLNQSLRAGMRLGLFPFPSGPGLIPDNPLFPLQPGPYPMGAGNFPLPPNPFALPGIGNLMRMPHPLAGGRRSMAGGAGGVGGSLHPHHQRNVAFDDNLDPETKLAQTPLDLQKSNCNVAPLVPPSLLQDESLNLSLRLGGSSLLGTTATASATSTSTSVTQAVKEQQQPPPPTPSAATPGTSFLGSQAAPAAKQPSKLTESRKEDQVVILPAASVLPGASPPQRSSMCVIDLDGDSDGSQSTTKDDGGRRKLGKEHKKERKVKDGKIKKKKDKKDKSKSKEREREQQLKELTAGTASSSAVLTMGMIGAEEALMEQLRKERKEKKEKRKDKVKKEKRKERERAQQQSVGGDTLMVTSPPAGDSLPGPAVPKLIMKLSGSGATPSPRSDTPDHHHPTVVATTTEQPKRDGSPELARISALVTRPPKLKPTAGGGIGGKGKKDDSLLDDDAGGFDDVAFASAGAPTGTKHHSLPVGVGSGDLSSGANNRSAASSGIMPTIGTTGTSSSSSAASSSVKGSSKAARVGAEYGGGKSGVVKLPPGTIATGGTSSSSSSSRKAPKDGSSSKGSKATALASSSSSSAAAVGAAAHHHHHHHASSASALAAVAAPAQMTDVDGNTVWICPACGRVDDGTPMIGCDGCDAWYHWVCVGITVPPEDNEDWYCRVCIGKMQDSHADTEKQRKRKKKDKKTPKD